jgi:unsaturated rhamnogalacturonyl hydrolase
MMGLLAIASYPLRLRAQTSSTATIADNATASPGDTVVNPGPLAAHLSPALTHRAVRAAMKKVVDWQLPYAGLIGAKPARYDREWTYAALYDGLLAYSNDTGDPAAHDAVLRAATQFGWQLRSTDFPNADDEALGHAYLDLYAEQPDPLRIAATKALMDRLIARRDEPKPLWWWCDALYMAPPTLVRLAKTTGDHRYIDFMNHQWWDVTTALLYDPQQYLYFRDDRFLDLAAQHEANGQPIFWSRGNGWVVAGLVNILRFLPADDPARPRYEQLFQQMVTRIASLQPADGLWRTGLLDSEAYAMPEVSGSAFFTYAMAFGMRAGLLDRATFEPVVRKAWAAMLTHIYADGRLGNIQPVGFAPDKFEPSSSYVYGVGAFLLAGTELDRLSERSAGKHRHHKL